MNSPAAESSEAVLFRRAQQVATASRALIRQTEHLLARTRELIKNNSRSNK
jgi:uncharacterized protein YaaN involved in tellurite resistance